MDIPKSCAEIIKGRDINEFQLVSLLNKRLRELIYGAKPLVDDKRNNIIETAISELLSEKIKPYTPK